jgi:hypothetical protein
VGEELLQQRDRFAEHLAGHDEVAGLNQVLDRGGHEPNKPGTIRRRPG